MLLTALFLVSLLNAPLEAVSQTIPVKPPSNPDRVFQLSELKTATIRYGGRSMKVWVMDTPSKRNEGMMFLRDKDVKIEQGMLFVFPDEQPRSFWMRNTFIPLDIAYMNAAGRVLNVEAMKPHNDDGVPSKGPSKFVLEMKRGAFKKFGIKAGTVFKIPSSIKASL